MIGADGRTQPLILQDGVLGGPEPTSTVLPGAAA